MSASADRAARGGLGKVMFSPRNIRGVDHHAAKLDEVKVREIRAAPAGVSHKALAGIYGISQPYRSGRSEIVNRGPGLRPNLTPIQFLIRPAALLPSLLQLKAHLDQPADCIRPRRNVRLAPAPVVHALKELA